MITHLGPLTIFGNFDSSNFLKAELVEINEQSQAPPQWQNTNYHDYEINIWTRPDCHLTPYENLNRTWFYFAIQGGRSHGILKINVLNLNKQIRLFEQGMQPVFRILPDSPIWERVRDKILVNETGEMPVCNISFRQKLPANPEKSKLYIAFTYPYTYTDMISWFDNLDAEMISRPIKIDRRRKRALSAPTRKQIDDEIYYHRECVCFSLENRRIELITISNTQGMSKEREERLANLFPEQNVERPFKFPRKKVVFLSARVHPGETPSSHVLNGFLKFILQKNDPRAIQLRRLFVFKFIPMLNPDGVFAGHYRSDVRGVNLNRVYLNPSPTLHSSVYATRKLLLYHHLGKDTPDDFDSEIMQDQQISNQQNFQQYKCDNKSGLYLYIDMHAHATKRGIFMYGNHFDDLTVQAEAMLFPRLMAMNCQNFDFSGCNFTERLMNIKDRRDGASREGSGRVACLKLTGLIRSYTLEMNYNTGRVVNNIVNRPIASAFTNDYQQFTIHPPKFTVEIFEDVGRSIAESILDLTEQNKWSRLSHTEFKTVDGLKLFLLNRLKFTTTEQQKYATSTINNSTTNDGKDLKIQSKNKCLKFSTLPLNVNLIPKLSAPLKTTIKKHPVTKTKFSAPLSALGPRQENQNSQIDQKPCCSASSKSSKENPILIVKAGSSKKPVVKVEKSIPLIGIGSTTSLRKFKKVKKVKSKKLVPKKRTKTKVQINLQKEENNNQLSNAE